MTGDTKVLTIRQSRTPSGIRYYPEWDGKPFTTASNTGFPIRSILSFPTIDAAKDFLWSDGKVFE